jgi:hypothetical protein
MEQNSSHSIPFPVPFSAPQTEDLLYYLGQTSLCRIDYSIDRVKRIDSLSNPAKDAKLIQLSVEISGHIFTYNSTKMFFRCTGSVARPEHMDELRLFSAPGDLVESVRQAESLLRCNVKARTEEYFREKRYEEAGP